MTKASDRYSSIGEPKVRKLVYIKNIRILEVGIRNFSPNLVHTPNAYFSINSCIFIWFCKDKQISFYKISITTL